MNFSGLRANDRQLLLRGAKAILSVEGSETLQEIEWDTLAAIDRHLLNTGEDLRALPACAPTSEELRTFAAESDAAGISAVTTIWCLLPIVGGTLHADKVAVLVEFTAALGHNEALAADMASLAHEVTLWPKLRLFQRIFSNIFHLSLLRGVGQLLGAYLGFEAPAFGRRYDALATLPTDSFGYHLWDFYQRNGMKPPGRFGAYPYSQIGPHDAHHVLGSCDTSYLGELLIVPFECGASQVDSADMLVTTLLQIHAGMTLDPSVPARSGLYEPDPFFSEFARGTRVREDLLAVDWDFWRYVERPIAEVRTALCIGPGGNVS